MRYIAGGVIAALAIAVLLLALRVSNLTSAANDREEDIRGLEEKLAAADQRFIEQRELLRQGTLAKTARTPDEFLALFPARFPAGDWQPAESSFEDCWFRSADGLRLHGWLIRHSEPKAAVLYLHGNAGNLTHRAARAEMLSRRYAASVLVFDFRGYGRSDGTPTVEGLLHDARAARALLAGRIGIAEQDILLLGESLGGAVAVDLAAKVGARGLILESTFSSLKEVAASHYPALLVDSLVADRLYSAAIIGDYRGPLLQVHGNNDRTIPLVLGRKLQAAANEPKTMLVLAGHDHNDRLPEEYYRQLDEFMRSLPVRE